MAAKHLFLLLLQFIGWHSSCLAQRTPYSLQAAVDELHRREAAKYPLNAPPSQQLLGVGGSGVFLGGGPQEQDYWDDDTDAPISSGNNNRNRHRLNKVLAKYLERENYDADHGGLTLGPFGGYEFDEDNNNLFLNYPEEKKRASYFRERDVKFDNSPSTIFRERETPAPNGPDQAELTEQFLREIEESQELDREERYKEALRRLWEKYQQQENELDGNLFDEQKRMMASSTPNYYIGPLMQKKRTYPVLPWLPAAARKKRFPVAKRSTKRSPPDGAPNFGKTDEKVARELSELFGTPVEEKKKRSTDEQEKLSTTHAPAQATTTTTTGASVDETTHKENATHNLSNKKSKSTATDVVGHESVTGHSGHAGYHGHNHKQHQHRKRSDDHHAHDESHEEEESEEHEEHDEHDEHEEEEHEEDEDEHEEFEDGDGEEERKKKRDVSSGVKHNNWEIIKEDQILPGDLTNFRRKKSIDWSTYFGLNKKKKSIANDENANMAVKKRSTKEDNNEGEFDEKRKKRDFDPEKLESMDKKLQSIEDLIIDETIKYTGAHEGIDSPDEIRRLKDHVLSRLATAYSLEKMRRALERLRQSVDNENHLLRNVIEKESKLDENEVREAQKRLSVKKEKVQYDNNHLSPINEKSKEIHSNSMMSSAGNSHDKHNDDTGSEEDMKKKKKKRNGYARYPELPNDFSDFEEELGAGHYETLNDAYLGNKNYILGTNQCPLIEAMAERCRSVDLLSGDIHQELLPMCGVHQICYLCGTSQVACDYQYLAEADSICGHNNDCQAAARSVLMILRGTPGPQLGPKECLKNSCLYSAMREIGL